MHRNGYACGIIHLQGSRIGGHACAHFGQRARGVLGGAGYGDGQSRRYRGERLSDRPGRDASCRSRKQRARRSSGPVRGAPGFGGSGKPSKTGADPIVGYWADSFGGAFAVAGRGESKADGFDITYQYPDKAYVNRWRMLGDRLTWQIATRDRNAVEKPFASYTLSKTACRPLGGRLTRRVSLILSLGRLMHRPNRSYDRFTEAERPCCGDVAGKFWLQP